MSIAADPVFSQVARWLLFGVFAAALWHKLRAREAFTAVVDGYRLMPRQAAPFAAATVIALEAMVWAGLAFAATARPAAALAMALLAAYALAISVNLWRGRRDIDCGCLGPAGTQGRHRLSPWLPARNAALIAVAALVVVPADQRVMLWPDAAGIAAGAAVALLLYFAADQLAANRSLLERLLQ